MQQIIEKSYFDWSRDKNPKIQAKGWAEILEQREKALAAARQSKSARFLWPSAEEKGNSRYMSRRISLS